MPRPKGKHTQQLREEDRQRVRTLYFDGYISQKEIERRTGFTKAQIRYSIRNKDVRPRFNERGRDPILSIDQQERLVQHVTASKQNRLMSFWQLSWISLTILGIYVGYYCIRSTLRRHGFQRYLARRKPPLTQEHMEQRKKWAEEHVSWTLGQWRRVIWTDETWVTGGPHRKQYVTRRIDEALHPDCLVENHQQKGDWMFWACFSGIDGQMKGPCLFWEKDWGAITEEIYRRHTVPLIDGWIRLCKQTPGENLTLMQDGASAYGAKGTLSDLIERGITLITWPSLSPDLNPIETVWCKMKDYIEDKYGHIEKPAYDQIRDWVREAWDQIDEEYLKGLLDTMPQRCQDVIHANGGTTKW